MKFKKFSRYSQGFTLLEILLVVAAIAILAGIVILAINPSKQLGDTHNAARKAAVREINNAIQQYVIDHGSLPNKADWVGTDTYTICRTGQDPNDCLGGIVLNKNKLINTAYADNATIFLSDLTDNGTYLTQLPIDPEASIDNSGYEISKDSRGHVTVSAPLSENGVVISSGGTSAAPTVITDCGTEISTPGTYAITADLDCSDYEDNSAIVITVDSGATTLNCQNNTITAFSGQDGIYLLSAQNVTITNCTIEGGNDGMRLTNSTNNTIGPNININNASQFGLFVTNGSDNTLTGITVIVGFGEGIKIQYSPNNSLSDSSASGAAPGSNDMSVDNSVMARSTNNSCGYNKCRDYGGGNNLCNTSFNGFNRCQNDI